MTRQRSTEDDTHNATQEEAEKQSREAQRSPPQSILYLVLPEKERTNEKRSNKKSRKEKITKEKHISFLEARIAEVHRVSKFCVARKRALVAHEKIMVERERQKWRNREIMQDRKIRTHVSPNSGSQYLCRDLLSSPSVHSMHTCVMQMLHTCAHAGGQAYRHGDTQAWRRTCRHACVHTHLTSHSINSSRLVSRLQRRTYGRCSEPCSMGAERKVGGKVHPKQL